MKRRAERLVERFDAAGIDVLLVTDLVNLRYLTGFTGSNGLALVGPSARTFVTDFRYVEQAAEQVHPSWQRRRASQDLLDVLVDVLAEVPLRVGFEEHHTSVHDFGRLRELLDGRATLIEAGLLVEEQRVVKESEEIERIRAAAELADEAFQTVIDAGLIGRTEREVALAIEWEMRERGAQGASFDTIVATGPHGALPHATPRDVEIRRGELVVIDWGAQLDGYYSDCTRTVAAGTPDAAVRDVYELVLEAQLAGLEGVRPGASGRAVDARARRIITDAGHGEHFGHGLGHGVGLAIHEAPRLSQRSEDILATDSVLTVEPGVYLPGRFGIRIEDLVVVRDGGPEILSGLDKALIVAG